ncbi:MAG: hypothetical protein WAT58_00025 [Candidatus Dormiibacterota bacterium]
MAETPAPPAQLSEDRAYVWDGSTWQPAQYSPDGTHVWDGQVWRQVVPASGAPPRNAQGLDFTFEVGDQEKHTVRFLYDQMWGKLVISVDNEPVIQQTRILSFSTVSKYPFAVGVDEKHNVVIEKKRKLMYAGFRPQVATVTVDGKEIGQYDGSAWISS